MAQARKARNYFNQRFVDQIPGKEKVTMMDLIFYNPINNPMSQNSRKQAIEEIEEEASSKEEEIKLNLISNKSDEENTIPAPQIKIGANGAIVIDEESLVIENKETKRSREEIQKSKIIDGDFDTGYGIYKRRKRTKDWSKEETLLFYKALNNLGTDFTLMVELFNGRSRSELKMKFKKEERVNRPLIDKALMYPVHFDITELRRDAEQQLLMEQQKQKENSEKEHLDMIPYMGRSKRRKPSQKIKQPKPPKRKKSRDLYSALERGISSICEPDSNDEIDK